MPHLSTTKVHAVELYKQGQSASQIAEQLRISKTSVFRWIRAANVKARPRGYQKEIANEHR